MSNDKATPVAVDPVALSVIDWLNRQSEDLRRVGETIVTLEKIADGLGKGHKSMPLGTDLRHLAERYRSGIKAFHDALKGTTEMKPAAAPLKGGDAALTVVGGSDAKTGS